MDFLSTQKSKAQDPETTKQRLLKSAGNPKAEALEATRTFYKETGKDVRTQIKLGFPRSSQLEEKEKRKIAFTGESNLIYDKNFNLYRPHSREEFKRKRTPGIPLSILSPLPTNPSNDVHRRAYAFD